MGRHSACLSFICSVAGDRGLCPSPRHCIPQCPAGAWHRAGAQPTRPETAPGDSAPRGATTRRWGTRGSRKLGRRAPASSGGSRYPGVSSHFPSRPLPGPGGAPARRTGSSAPVRAWGAWQPGPGGQHPQGFLQASLGPQGLWWPLPSNLGPGRGPVPEGKDWKERLQGQGPSWGTRFAGELPGSSRPQRPPQGPAPTGDGAQRSSRPCPRRKPRATRKLLGKVCRALALPPPGAPGASSWGPAVPGAQGRGSQGAGPGWPHSFRAGPRELVENQTRQPGDLSGRRVQALPSSSTTPNRPGGR